MNHNWEEKKHKKYRWPRSKAQRTKSLTAKPAFRSMIASQNKRILINCVDKSSNGAEKGETSDKETFSDVVIVNND